MKRLDSKENTTVQSIAQQRIQQESARSIGHTPTIVGHDFKHTRTYSIGEELHSALVGSTDTMYAGRRQMLPPGTTDIASIQQELEETRIQNKQLQVELDLKNRELASLVTRDMNTREWMVSWVKKLRGIVESGSAHSAEILYNIFHDLQHNLHNTNSHEPHISTDDQEFLKRVAATYYDLTPAELKLCYLLRKGMSTKKIAQLLHTSKKTVENQRYRLRQKLQLSRDKNLISFLMAL